MQGADNLGMFNQSNSSSVTNQKGYEKPAWFENLWGRTPDNPKPTKPQDIELGSVNQNAKSLWSSWKSQDIETSTTASNDGNTSTSSGISGLFGSFTSKVNQVQEVQRNYPVFVALFLAGCGLITLAIFLIPAFLVFAPQKISMLLNLGSLCMLSAFAFLKGGFYNYFIKELLLNQEDKKRRLYTIGYFASILVSLYASIIMKSYLLTLLTMIVEITLLLYFVCASFPGGHTGLNFMMSGAWSFVKTCLRIK